jgi:hypothetical protein
MKKKNIVFFDDYDDEVIISDDELLDNLVMVEKNERVIVEKVVTEIGFEYIYVQAAKIFVTVNYYLFII